MCSPGRWPKARRRLPETPIAQTIQDILLKALLKHEKDLPGKSFKTALAAITAGKLEGSPFSEKMLDEVRMDLRIALKHAALSKASGNGRRKKKMQGETLRETQPW